MKKLLAVVALGVAFMAARPGTDLQLLTQLNGQPVRWQLPDAGPSGLYAAASGLACAQLTGSLPQPIQVVMLMPDTPLNVCVRPASSTKAPAPIALQWDGGCNTIARDFNFGVPVQPYAPYYVVVDTAATQICATGDGGTVSGSLWLMQ